MAPELARVLNVIGLPLVLFSTSAAPEATVTPVVLPRAVALPKINCPALTATAPTNVLLLLSVTLPVPESVMPPEAPPIVPPVNE